MNLFDRRRLLASVGALVKKIISSATGIVNFVTNLVMPTKITCEFSPVQSGTGDPSPSNVRPISGWAGCEIMQVGANYYNPNCEIGVQYDTTPKSVDVDKLIPGVWQNSLSYYNPSIVTLTKTSTGIKYITTDGRYQVAYVVKVKSGSSICASFSSTSNCNLCFYEKDWTPITRISSWNNAKNRTVTVPDKACYFELVFYTAADTETTFDNINISVSGDTEYSEYVTPQTVSVNWAEYEFLPTQSGTGDPSPSNVRPITPGLSITRDDSTTLDVYGGTLTLNNDGTSTVTTQWACADVGTSTYLVDSQNTYLKTFDGISYGAAYSYTYSRWNKGQIDSAEDCFCNVAFICSSTSQVHGQTAAVYAYARNSGSYFEYWIQASELEDVSAKGVTATSIKNWAVAHNMQIVFKSRSVLNTYTLSATETQRALTALGETSKIVYGGTLTINEDGTGTLVAGWAIKDLGDINWFKSSGGNMYYTPNGAVPYALPGNIICSCFKNDGERSSTPWYGDDGTFRYYSRSGYSTREIYIHDERYSSAEAFKAGVTGELFAYETDSPQTYNLTASQVNSLVGTNNIWHDMNGSITVEYYKKS